MESIVERPMFSKASEDRNTQHVEFDRETYSEHNMVAPPIGWHRESRYVVYRFL